MTTNTAEKSAITDVDTLVKRYIQLRDLKSRLKERQAEELRKINDPMKDIEAILLHKLNDANLSKMGSEHGTVYKTSRSSVRAEDWDEYWAWVLDNKLYHFIDRRPNKSAVEEFVEAEGELPPGISMTTETTVGIRRK